MKKKILGTLVVIVALSVGVTTAFAAGLGRSEGAYGRRNFLDADMDGICDNAACVYADADGDGVCDVCGTNHGRCLIGGGSVFVDEDGDGVCDHYVSGQCQSQYQDQNQRYGQGQGNGQNQGYGQGQSSGAGHGSHGRHGHGHHGG